ncbi:M23 family metallopeptidase [Effusibacillus dendaii]|uniref:M23ase beta-sheet core domain-containing protein n=1 Tax=Effusibacillus dendaii TaxID=2743772 RepID=A0A7I8DFL3_9BACL|nr:M23 family metallopeptidase [Effusibacillus dendaii]BCJ86691.1 hypothetical protein skT53_16760 [Effusibacillus dendaii]
MQLQKLGLLSILLLTALVVPDTVLAPPAPLAPAVMAHENGKSSAVNGTPIPTDLFTWPVPVTKEISSDYGWRFINGQKEFHTGIDVAADYGDPIDASADGVVLYAGPAEGFGNWIVIKHRHGLMTIYGHMYRKDIEVKPGQAVKKGQEIGRVGAAGQSDGPHLHFGIATGIKGDTMITVNPWNFLPHLR